ncbi:hypothetical protein EC957_004601 [Mortierella hygrophila]|uniref:BAR domain-containing protein n=1 Tax=Mortierella hygrophila TaxID=979708 RepID=A0A9P6F0K7_9FUNG|nr:hypothetical protein EC957_004601 [Mortierella hygrophila]
MSQQPLKKKYGNEFLCKTRYRNTLPLPPFAPKLLLLPSSSERYIKYQETGLTEATAHEMILDNQYAMPIDLIEMRENFFGEGRPAHHGDNSNTILNPTDELLLTVPVRTNVGGPAALNALNNGAIAAEVHRMPVPKTKLPNVSWLRRTEYISSETPTGAGKGAYKDTSSRKDAMVVDNSREGQITAIEKTFQRFMKKADRISPARSMTEDEFLASLKHPTKPGVTAVESLPIFPDFNIWGNSYTLVTFDVDPEINNERSVQSQANDQGTSKAQTAQRSSNALIKPMSDANDPETWLAYYLPDMEDAKEINRRKRKRAQLIAQGMMVTADEEDHDRVIPYTLQRDYTYSTNPCPALSQLVFTFRDDADNTRQKSAFYNTTQSKLMLRKKRVKRYEDDDPPITHIDAKSRTMTSDEMAEKNEALKAISSSGLKKSLNRATTSVMAKTGNMGDRSTDREFEEEEKRARQLESKAEKLHKEANGYAKSLREMMAAQVRIANTLEQLYDESTPIGPEGQRYKDAVTKMESQARDEVDASYRTSVLEPIGRYYAYFPEINEAIRRRNKKYLEYDHAKSKVRKLVERPSQDSSKLPQAEHEANVARDMYEAMNAQLTSELPKVIDSRVAYLDPSFEAVVKSQLSFAQDASNTLEGLRQFFPPEPQGYELAEQADGILQQMRELTICGLA